MSEFAPFLSVSEALRSLLWETVVKADVSMQAILHDKSQITLAPPYQIADGRHAKKSFLSVYLIRVQPNANIAMAPLQPAEPRNPPLAMDLVYLITPLTNSADNDQTLLGRVIKGLHETPVLEAAGPLINGAVQPGTEAVRVLQLAQSIEEIAALWTAFRQPFHLSVFYSVGPVLLR